MVYAAGICAGLAGEARLVLVTRLTNQTSAIEVVALIKSATDNTGAGPSGLQLYVSTGTFRDPFQLLDEFNFRPAEGIDHYPIPRIDNDRGSFSFDYRSAFERLTRRERFERIDWNLAPLAKERLSRCAWDTSR